MRPKRNEEETNGNQFELDYDENELVVDQDSEWNKRDEEGENQDWLVYELESDTEDASSFQL